jgi:hypothetical protein
VRLNKQREAEIREFLDSPDPSKIDERKLYMWLFQLIAEIDALREDIVDRSEDDTKPNIHIYSKRPPNG